LRRSLTALVAAGLAVGGVVTVDTLSDLTQTRPDKVRPGWRSEVVFDVRWREEGRRPPQLADRLWGACRGTAERATLPPGVVELGGDRARVVVRPALGHHARQRLTGCLEDVTLDRAKGSLVSIRDLPPA
jgi:hypothetical protein